MIKAKDMNQLFTYIILLFSSFWIFFCMNESSMIMEGLLLFGILILLNLNPQNIRDVIFAGLIAVFFLVTLYLSGRFFERGGYNIPYKFAIKFINLLFAIMCASAMNKLNFRQRKVVVLTAFVTMFISGLVSVYYVTFVDSFAIRYRDLVGITQTVSFDQLYALPILFPALVFFYVKYNKVMRNRIWYILFSAVVFICVLESSLATAILLTLGGVVLCFLKISFEKRDKKSVVIAVLLFIAAVLFILFHRQIGEFLYGLTEDMNSTLQGRLRRVIDMIFSTEHENSYSIDRRLELADYSIDTFRAHPLFGVGIGGIRYGVIGYHQEWPDVLGVCGIVGTAIIAAVFVDAFRRIKSRTVDAVDRSTFFLGGILFFILGFLNPCLYLPELYVLMVILPNMSALIGSERRQL